MVASNGGVMSIFDESEHEYGDEWLMGDYTGERCEKCKRERVRICENGKRRCDKCNWCPEDRIYIDKP